MGGWGGFRIQDLHLLKMDESCVVRVRSGCFLLRISVVALLGMAIVPIATIVVFYLIKAVVDVWHKEWAEGNYAAQPRLQWLCCGDRRVREFFLEKVRWRNFCSF